MSTTDSAVNVGESTQVVSAAAMAPAFPFVVTTAGVGVGTTQPISALTVFGGGSPPLVVQGSGQNFAMLGLRGDGATDTWQVQATNTGGSVFRIAYPQNSPKLTIDQAGNATVTGKLTAAGLNLSGPLSIPAANFKLTGMTTPPAGTQTVDVVVDPATGQLYRQN
jgi:hypothetical protein